MTLTYIQIIFGYIFINVTVLRISLLTYLSRMGSILIVWKSPFSFKQTVKTLVRHHIMWCLIRVFPVCPCPIYRTPGLNGLILVILILPQNMAEATKWRHNSSTEVPVQFF